MQNTEMLSVELIAASGVCGKGEQYLALSTPLQSLCSSAPPALGYLCVCFIDQTAHYTSLPYFKTLP